MMVRELGVSDGAELQTLRLEALRACPEAFGSSWEEERQWDKAVYANRIVSGECVYFGAFAQDRLVGLVGLAAQRRLKTRHRADVVSFFVEPAFRGRGIGRALLRAVIAGARAGGVVEQLELAVVKEQTAARSLYGSLGFVVCGETPRAVQIGGRYYDEYLMVKRLDACGSGEERTPSAP